MKARIVLYVIFLFSFLSPVVAQSHGTQSRRDSIKESRIAEDRLLHNKAVEAIKNKLFVLKADRMSSLNSRTEGCNPLTCFILVDGNKVIVQPYSDYALKSTAVDYKIFTNKKGETEEA